MPVYKQGVEDAVKRTLFTTIGDIIAASAVDTPARIAAPASGQVLTGQGVGVLPAWAAGPVTRAGGNTTEASTTSLTQVDLVTVASLTIATSTPFHLAGVGRKAAGGAFTAALGLTLNATQVATATISGASRLWRSNGVNQAMSGGFWAYFAGILTSYLQGGMAVYTPGTGTDAVVVNATRAANAPVATLTSIIITAITEDASVEIFCDEVHVYTYAVS